MGKDSVRCGFSGCGHWVKVQGQCGRRPCPRNAAGIPPMRGGAPGAKIDYHEHLDAWAVADPFGDAHDHIDVWGAQQQAATLMDLPPSTPLSKVRFAMIDVETNELDPAVGSVIQFAVVECDGAGNVLDRWSTLVKPRDGQGVGLTDLHGISEDDVADAPSWDEVAGEVEQRLAGRVLAAHNLFFDQRWIAAEQERSGRPFGEGGKVAGVCTMQLARGSTTEHDSNRLGDLCDEYGIEMERWHDAESDAAAAATLLPHLLAEAEMDTVGDLVGLLWDSKPPLARTTVAA